MTTAWNILTLKRTPDTNLVVEVGYEYAVIGSGSVAMFSGDIVLDGDPESPTFIPYENLTKENVVSWVVSELGEEFIETLTAKLAEDIQYSISQNTSSNLIMDTNKFI